MAKKTDSNSQVSKSAPQPTSNELAADVVQKAQEAHSRAKVLLGIQNTDTQWHDLKVQAGIVSTRIKFAVDLATMSESIAHGLKREAMRADVLKSNPSLVSKIKEAKALLTVDKPEKETTPKKSE